MKIKIEMGTISAGPGEKAQGYAKLADTGMAFPLTLINGIRYLMRIF